MKYNTVTVDTVVNMREGFNINMFEEVTHLSSGPPQPLSDPSVAGQFVTQK